MFCELGAGAFLLREKNEAHQSRERDRFVGRLLVRDWYDDDDDDRCARIINQSINQSIPRRRRKKKRVASSSIIKSHLSPVGKTHPTDSLTTVFSSASSSASSQPRPRSLPPPLVGHSHFLLSCNRCADFLQKRETISSRETIRRETCEKTPSLYTYK